MRYFRHVSRALPLVSSRAPSETRICGTPTSWMKSMTVSAWSPLDFQVYTRSYPIPLVYIEPPICRLFVATCEKNPSVKNCPLMEGKLIQGAFFLTFLSEGRKTFLIPSYVVTFKVFFATSSPMPQRFDSISGVNTERRSLVLRADKTTRLSPSRYTSVSEDLTSPSPWTSFATTFTAQISAWCNSSSRLNSMGSHRGIDAAINLLSDSRSLLDSVDNVRLVSDSIRASLSCKVSCSDIHSMSDVSSMTGKLSISSSVGRLDSK